MDDLIRSEADCRRHIVAAESSTVRAHLLFFSRFMGVLMGEMKGNHYITLFHFLWGCFSLLRFYLFFLERKKSMVAEFADAMRNDRGTEAVRGDVVGSPCGCLMAQSEERAIAGLRWKDPCHILFQECVPIRIQLLANFALKVARIQKGLIFALQSERCRGYEDLFTSAFADIAPRRRSGAPEEKYGLVLSDVRLLHRGRHKMRERCYQVRVIQSLAPAFPQVHTGDVILSINGRSVATIEGARLELWEHPKKVQLLLLREARVFSVIFAL
ncbi:hypothetical protein TCSYLVIO_003379 [Trypanosoma cruzi]|uniref:PDZ domain-containing protein n=1 Tax=Trypanosoma cruzi Dm28c TaxID=1416333 RepID=V5DNS3_TRYCR|nr:hypothetical protein TCSYLVIO_003379 [Trypanosoma cruzi]ESS69056.1 hypothetical protein TCDM_02069 [Trypanosoma cruzi Dm28c]KAF8286049.1 hypothetical protein TcBrA4_0027350 [Trypanosoma cruzi]PBJ80975.1 hypothetical protein BCY84_01186 [Trypanosoma cruzi cruzi]RNF24146.1 hypothetical protein TcG_00954 [Trypanosoma cruzi]